MTIRIEITDLMNEDKNILIKLAEVLMDAAGYTKIKVPKNPVLNPSLEGISAVDKYVPIFEDITKQVDEIDKDHELEEILNTNLITPHTMTVDELPPYAHCGVTETLCMDKFTAIQPTVNLTVDLQKGLTTEKPKRTRKPKADLPPVPPLPTEVPAPPPPSVGEFAVTSEDTIDTSMKLITKMTNLVQTKKINHNQLTSVIKSVGLNEVLDICSHEELVPQINAALDTLLGVN